jgi:photoactive yellow protein
MTTAMMGSRIAPRAAASLSPSSFVPQEVLQNAANLTRADVNACDFGVVKVDDNATILLFNQYEADLAGVSPAQAEGKKFFTQIGPCANNGLFFGSFKKGVAANNLNVLFPYTFTYKMKPTNVMIHLYRDNASKTNWIFVKKA